jgi:propionyl-CoA carboxylase alpha chain
MFRKILIANRGEIACRIIRTARRMGIATVAVYSEADRDALHVEMADEAALIGPAPASQSYLDIAAIVAACRETGAEAVHPGYGFLSERAAFVAAIEQAGIVFIGPHRRAIEALGDKIESKKIASAAGVSTVPGFLGTIDSAEQAMKIADEIGYPVMIKASAGGGGKGMRLAHARHEVAEGFARARSEAKSSFGDDRVFVEKFIVDPRHIEIQVLGDKHGHVIWLGERECSIQRRNQKVIEEAPSPLLDAATRRRMGEQAVALARAVGYDSAGTVEFVAAQDRSFYFLEMNTRLQVEHPVTELVAGVDLVEEMIRSAYGLELRLSQDQVRTTGWAIESRIYAEDPTRNFLPSTGRLVKFRPPAEGTIGDATVRLDSGVCEGSEISIHYDPMIAKLVTHAPDRSRAIEAQARALDGFVIDGVRHNVLFLAALMQQERWRAGRLSTAYIHETFPGGFAPLAPAGANAHLLAAIAAHIHNVESERKSQISGQLRAPAASAASAARRQRAVLLGGARYDVEATGAGGQLDITLAEGKTLRVASRWAPGEPVWEGVIDGVPVIAQARPILNGFMLVYRGMSVEAHVYTRRAAELATLMPVRTGEHTLKALLCPMPGLVRSIAVRVDQEVKAGEALCMVEAMKMENVLLADRDVKVKKIIAREGDSLAVDAVIMEFA